MEKTEKTHGVIVQKDISLATGESLGVFTQKLRDAGTKFVKQKLNLPTKEAGVYPIEIFSKSVVFDVYQYGPNVDEDKRARFYAVAYSRNNDGTFEFSTMTEVERVTSYQPKANAAVTKAAKPELDDAPGWLATEKSLWSGVL